MKINWILSVPFWNEINFVEEESFNLWFGPIISVKLELQHYWQMQHDSIVMYCGKICVENIDISKTLYSLSIIHITLVCNSPYLNHHKLNLYALPMCTNNLELKRINLECFMNHLLEWHQSHLYCNKYITASDTLYSSQYLW